ncbi:hypothetical protein V7O61_03060 [Methanolobus sp. WCC1]|jgi:hypothetical protein|uniref:hypothetical protein n=1 Tax=unclassified Methanolobus TaxID=2629569 RepID=UPI0032556F0B
MDVLIYFSLFLTILTITIYWFGMAYNSKSSDAKKEKIYKDGGMFFLRNVIIPSALFSVTYSSNYQEELFVNKLATVSHISIHLLIIIVICDAVYKRGFNKKFAYDYNSYITSDVADQKSNIDILLVFYSMIVIYIAASAICYTFSLEGTIIDNNSDYYHLFLTVYISFLLLTSIARKNGNYDKSYKKVKITTKNNAIIEGFLLNKGEFISLHTNDSIQNINADCIYKIEEEYGLYRYDFHSLIRRYNMDILKGIIRVFSRKKRVN